MGESKVSMINLNEIFQDVKSDLIGKLLNETKDSKTCMWYLMCALDGMPDKEILELAGFTIPQIQAARTEFLMKKYQGNSPVYSEVQKLKSQVKEIVQENRDVRSSIEKGLDKAIQEQIEKVDDETQEIIIGVDGQPETEVVERILPRFRVTTVFDVSQTDGEPLPTLETRELDGDVIIYEDFIEGLEDLSPVPFQFIEIESGAKGYYSNSEKYIAIQSNMSQAQTMKTAVHETAHAILHDRDIMEENGMTKDRMTKEVEAESVAYVVCNHFGLNYSGNIMTCQKKSRKQQKELRGKLKKPLEKHYQKNL